MSNTERLSSLGSGEEISQETTALDDQKKTSVQETKESIKMDLDAFLEQMNARESQEEKISECLKVLEELLKNPATVNWKFFWGVRKSCLPLFQSIEQTDLKGSLWERFVECTKEARLLKAFRDEEGEFIVSQIDLAIASLEEDVKSFSEGREDGFGLEKDENLALFDAKTLSEKRSYYVESYTKMVWLSSFSSRIAALRKELSEASMRVKTKSAFFKRLFVLGNMIFPLRKSLVERVSSNFAQDVEEFVKTHFGARSSRESLKKTVFFLRKEIKLLQGLAKALSISSDVFASTRLQLSECWDRLKGLEKEIRKEQGELRQASNRNLQELDSEISSLSASVAEGMSVDKASSEIARIHRKMRSVDLVYADVQALKVKLKEVSDVVQAQQEEQARVAQEAKEKEKAEREERLKLFLEEIHFLEQGLEGELELGELDALKEKEGKLRETFSSLGFLSKGQVLEIEKRLDACLEALSSQRERVLLKDLEDQELEVDDERLLLVIELKENRRRDLKKRLEDWKRLVGGSGLDFEKAMHYSSLIQEGKEALITLDSDIQILKSRLNE